VRRIVRLLLCMRDCVRFEGLISSVGGDVIEGEHIRAWKAMLLKEGLPRSVFLEEMCGGDIRAYTRQ
jgi:hypothetical protein